VPGSRAPGDDALTVLTRAPNPREARRVTCRSACCPRRLPGKNSCNLQRFTPFPGSNGKVVPADPNMPDYKRDVQFTVNGQFQPVVKSKAGQTEIWVLANVSEVVYTHPRL